MSYTIISPQDAKQMIEKENAILIDVREIDERNTSHIDQSISCPLSGLTPEDILEKSVNKENIIFICAKGKRSQIAAIQLKDAKKLKIYSVDGGIAYWKEIFPINS